MRLVGILDFVCSKSRFSVFADNIVLAAVVCGVPELRHSRRFGLACDFRRICTLRVMHRPEILAPAGCLQRLKTAIAFGADAVYVGGTRFSLRKNADNFNRADLAAGIAYAHAHGAKVYVACNIMPLQRDWAELTPTWRYSMSCNRMR